ncbi:Enoyl-CoA hydratase/carnithine racemase [Jatrophihabitans endophyticus]|uniref:Enoyl-CoA hydratase/carnithine racemase n=1 Tax=Jatrophihabitans endophyticus TaxID=1206085 RepID=A0A1M5PUU7_9ACTN|nr:enoyl-CoA hydratase/isomerase family protein [Jatrophihabitans endophyticus]SHH05430.1 Enoyl-CoA hydratase/carnithine racemase [Jatrophihabitans endophyticus]
MTEPLTAAEFAARSPVTDLRLDADGTPVDTLTVVDVGTPQDRDEVAAAVRAARRRRVGVLVGTARAGVAAELRPLVAELDCTIVAELDCTVVARTADSPAQMAVADPDAALAEIAATVARAPRATAAFVALLRQTAVLDPTAGIAAESAVYSTLLAGPEFAAWLATRPRHAVPAPDEPAVLLTRDDRTLTIELDRPGRRNAFDRAMRDGLVEAFELVAADDSITHVELRGRGPAFCAGGDLAEFGTSPDPASAHLVRIDRSVGSRVDRCRDRVTAYLHGACVGSGIEVPAFAADVVVAPDTTVRLPELSMGLVPGAGGTVSITRRTGRWRVAFLGLTGRAVDAGTVLDWGLGDRVGE